jgi:hypothetical protein
LAGREQPAGDPLRALRTTQLEVAHQLGLDGAQPGETQAPDPRSVLLVGDTDLMVNSANTLAHLAGVPVA